MGLKSVFRRFLKQKKGITLVEIMIAISILSICMAYIAYDSREVLRAMRQIDEKDRMLYAAQGFIEKFKTGITDNEINGYTVSVDNSETDVNVTENLRRLKIIVSPRSGSPVEEPFILYTYVYSDAIQTPEKPMNLTATVSSATSITLNWSLALNATSYNIKRRAGGEADYTQIASGIAGDAYTDSTPLQNTTYYYAISGSNSDVIEGPNSDEASAIINVKTESIPPVADAYVRDGIFYRNTNYGTSKSLYIRNGGSSSLKYKTYLKFDIKGISGNILDAKIRLYGYGNTDFDAGLYNLSDDSWTETGIRWSNAPTEGTSLGTLAFGKSSAYVEQNVKDYCVSESQGDKIISFVVTSPNSTQGTGNSREASSNKPQLVLTYMSLSIPVRPQNLEATPGDRKITLNWDTVIGAESYNVKKSTTQGGPYTTIENTTDKTYMDNSVINGTTYYYVVSAVNGAGEGDLSNEVSAIPEKIITVTYSPDADTYVRGGDYAANNYGSVAKLQVKDSESSEGEQRNAYFKFDLSNMRGKVISAHLKLYGNNMDNDTAVDTSCFSVGDSTWDEDTITFNNAPEIGDEIGDFTVDNTQEYREVDLTGYVKNQVNDTKIVNIAVRENDDSQLLEFNSRENIINKPKLVIVKTLPRPDAPQDLNAVPDNAKISLDWSSSDGTTSYTVKRSTVDGGPYINIAQGLTNTAYVDTGLINGTTYYYVVSATNLAGEGDNSNQVYATPNVVTTETFTPVADATVQSYYPGTNYGTSTSLNVVKDNINNKRTYFKFNLSGYTNNTPVYAKLRIYGKTNTGSMTVNGYKVSDTSWTETGITHNNAPSLGTQTGGVTVRSTAKYYDIDVTDYIATQIQNSKLITIAVDSPVALVTNSALFNSKESASNKPQLYIKFVEGIPKVPQNLVGEGGATKATLTWDPADGAVTYKVKVSTSYNGSFTQTGPATTATTCTLTGLTSGTKNFYVVSAVNAKGESANSRIVCVIPLASGSTSKTRVIFPSEDTYVQGGSNTVHGAEATMLAKFGITKSSSEYRETFINFNMSALPSNAILGSAQLIIYGSGSANNMTVYVYRITDSLQNWSEGTLNGTDTLETDYLRTSYPITLRKKVEELTREVVDFAKTEFEAGDKWLGISIWQPNFFYAGRVGTFYSKENTSYNPPMMKITYTEP